MLKKYAPFLVLGPISNFLWASWVLPQINEQGTIAETLQWMLVQLFLPAFFAICIVLRLNFVFWIIVVYSGFMLLFSLGVLGWGLMGDGTPFSVYVVCFILFVMGFGLLYQSLKSLNIGKEKKIYEIEN